MKPTKFENHPTRHLFRVVGAEQPIKGTKVFDKYTYIHEAEVPIFGIVQIIQLREWILASIHPDDLPEVPNIASGDREIVNLYKAHFASHRPVAPIIIDSDKTILEGWYRAAAAREMRHVISAYVPYVAPKKKAAR